MLLGRKVRLYPTKRQSIEFARYAGTAHFAWNESLALCQEYYRTRRAERDALYAAIINVELLDGETYASAIKTANLEVRGYKVMLTEKELREHLRELRNTTCPWLWDIPEAVTKQATKDLMKAYRTAFANERKNKVVSKRRNKKTGKIINPYGFPQFKKKFKTAESFYQRTDAFHAVSRRSIKITGVVKPVRCKYAAHIPEHVVNPRVTLDNGYWYLSYSYEAGEPVEKSFDDIVFDDIVGIDLGVKSMAVTSQGDVFENPNYDEICMRLKRRIQILQRRLCRKYEKNKDGHGHITKTQNIIKLERKISKLSKRVRDYRNTARHEFTSKIVNAKPKVVVIEDLNTKGMMSNKRMARSVGQVGFYEIRRQLAYKGQREGIYVVDAPRFYPSTQTCSCCLEKTGPRGFDGLRVREWECPQCHAHHERDLNAARSLALWLIDNASGSVCWSESSGSLTPTSSTFGESGDETQFLLEEMSIKERVLSLHGRA